MTIEALVEQFKSEHPEYGTPEGIQGQCFQIAVEFQEAVLAAGLADTNEQFKFWDVEKVWECEDHYIVDCSQHWVFRLGDIVYDWSARQFDATLPFPLVLPVDMFSIEPTGGEL